MAGWATFGVIPDYPETGFGYIKSEDELDSNTIIGSILNVIEKPNKHKAEKLIKDRRFTWNSGMFLFKANPCSKKLKNIIRNCYYCKSHEK